MFAQLIDLREITHPIASPIDNTHIDFSKITTHLVALECNSATAARSVTGFIPMAATIRAD